MTPASAPDTVLLWGLLSDPPIAAVHSALQRNGSPVLLLDHHAIANAEVELTVDATIAGFLRIATQTFDLGAFKSLYLRPRHPRQQLTPEQSAHTRSLQEILSSWVELTPALVLNRPSHMAANNSKPYQARWIESLGFRVPETLLTTDPDAALEFWKRHGDVIYKSVSGIRSIVSRLTPAHRQRLADITTCPTQFQAYIPGTEYRVHVIGNELISCSIHSTADDYRYSLEAVDIQPCHLPDEIAARCRSLATAMHLPLAGLDLRRTPDGQWYCFEVNPSPAFTCFEGTTSKPIAEAIARLLATPHPYA